MSGCPSQGCNTEFLSLHTPENFLYAHESFKQWSDHYLSTRHEENQLGQVVYRQTKSLDTSFKA